MNNKFSVNKAFKSILLGASALLINTAAQAQWTNTYPTTTDRDVTIGAAGTLKRLTVYGSILMSERLSIGGSDFSLGLYDGRDQGLGSDKTKWKTANRAIVHGDGDQLVFNWDGDFEGGLVVHGPGATFNGSVGIGTGAASLGTAKLAVEGTIAARGVKVLAGGAAWPDYVFKNTYKLRPLSEVESFIKTNSHLPEVPSAAQVSKEGINLSEMDATLLKKIEELTLYVIEQNKQLQEVKKENEELSKEVEKLKK